MAYTIKTWSETLSDLTVCMERWGVDQWEVEPRKPRFGGALTSFYTPEQRMVQLHYVKDGADVELSIDKWPRPIDNLRALYLTVDSLRLNEYRGIAEAVRQAYAQLPAPKVERDPFEVLGVGHGARMDIIEAAYRILSKEAHPDAPAGSRDKWDELQAAIERIRKERRE